MKISQEAREAAEQFWKVHMSPDVWVTFEQHMQSLINSTLERCAAVADDHAVAWGLAHSTPAIAIANAIRQLMESE